MRWRLSLQRRLDSATEFSILRGNAALVPIENGTVLADKEFFEIPGHLSSRVCLIERGVGLRGASCGMHLVEQFEAGAVGG